MKLAHIADRVARDIYTRPINHTIHTDAVIRDACDLATWHELPTRTLDRLCDMVWRRLYGPHFWRWRHETERVLREKPTRWVKDRHGNITKAQQ